MEEPILVPTDSREEEKFVPQPRKKHWYARKSFWTPFIIFVLTAGVLFVSSRPQPDPVYDTITVEPRTVAQVVNVTGRVQPKDRLALAFTQSGTVSTVSVSVGDEVGEGQMLAVLESREANLQLTQAEASLAATRAQLAQSQAALEIQRLTLDQLRDQGRTRDASIQEQHVKQAEAALAASHANVRQAEAVVEAQTFRLEAHVLRAPIGGTVSRVDVKAGAFAPAGQSAIEIISTRDHDIEAFIPETEIAKIHVGDTAIVTLDAYGRDIEFAAALTHLDPAETVVASVPNYRAIFRFLLEDERAKSGMTANIRFIEE